MYNQNIAIHFVGIGGVGMAGIAEVLINLGYIVSGSDIKPSQLTDHLSSLGARIYFGHQVGNIPPQVNVVVLSSAIKDGNPELEEARRRQLVIIPRAEMLAELMRMKYGIAVAGSHGKTSTTSLTAKILLDLGFDPTVIIGGRVLTQATGATVGKGQYLLAEADESDGSFCLLRPAIAVVTNIDAEHMSFYSSFGALEAAFLQFMNSVPFYGLIAYCGDDPVLNRISKSLKRRTITFGVGPKNDVSATQIDINGWNSSFNLIIKEKDVGRITLPVPGYHMVSNSLGAIAVALELGAYPEEVIESLASFPGVSRRTELVGKIGHESRPSESVLLIDDYGHHPSEIKATLKAIREGILKNQKEGSRLIVFFQPHRYSRTKELFTEFLLAFESADAVFISDIYSAGEDPIEGINSELLVASMRHPDCKYLGPIENALDQPLDFINNGDVIVTMGAGSVNKFCRQLFTKLQSELENVGQLHH